MNRDNALVQIHVMKDLTDRLNKLLSDPQPGLYTWTVAVENLVKRLEFIWTGRGYW